MRRVLLSRCDRAGAAGVEACAMPRATPAATTAIASSVVGVDFRMAFSGERLARAHIACTQVATDGTPLAPTAKSM